MSMFVRKRREWADRLIAAAQAGVLRDPFAKGGARGPYLGDPGREDEVA
jgi:hypothetical protein